MGTHVIKIRYADLPGGLYARAEVRGRDTVIYLLPGLTAAQRRTALQRVRSSARLGKGPRLPAAGLARARVADWVRIRARAAVAALHLRPLAAAPSIVIILATVFLVLWTPLSVRVSPPAATRPRPSLHNPPAVTPGPSPAVSGGLRRLGGGHGNSTPAGPPGTTVRTSGGVPSTTVTTRPGPAPAQPGTPPHTPAATPAPQPSPSAAPSPSPSQSGSGDGSLCLNLGLLNICL
jgi:hypothetical protein